MVWLPRQWPMGIWFACLMIVHAGSAHAGLMTALTVTTSNQPAGLTLYDYTLTNLSTSDLPTVDLMINVAGNANLQNITGPSGWMVFYDPGDTTAEWYSPSSDTDIAPGASATFSFESAIGPGLQDYLITGATDDPPAVDTNYGQIASPTDGGAAVPEPAGLLLVLCGTTGIFGGRWLTAKRRLA